MNDEQSNIKVPMSSGMRKFWIAATVLLVAALIIGASSLAFVFESPSIKYKFGWDKTLLRIGKVIGLTAAVLLLLQLPIAGRIKGLDRFFSLPGLYRIHRYNGYIIAFLVLLHPTLVFWPEGRLMIPLEARYWPEWVGAALLTLVLVQIGMAKWRTALMTKYRKWLYLHRFIGTAIIVMLVVHVLYVSETFEYTGLPRAAVLIAAAAVAVIWVMVQAQRLRRLKPAYAISAIDPAGTDAYAIDFQPVGNHHLKYLPGQFAFFSFKGRQVSAEWHPFTISSSPSRPDGLQVTIRRCGDWTNRVDSLTVGDRVFVQGPFGRFSHVYEGLGRELVMIAGGIGITPMLSMLRHMVDRGDQRPITLLWSNQTGRHLFVRDELDSMGQSLKHFRWIPVFTRTREPFGDFGRLTREKLEKHLTPCRRDAAVYVCGPPVMIRQVRSNLTTLGFNAASIRTELFDL